ncbi:MAG: zf-HC2 domain-containing protein [Candidatus Latescibacteria bacterium]|nr:zf-HC2 domain-containing protein [Candidatus Latescibacterota bacterium]
MNCRSAESLFSSFVEDEISQEERRALEAHLMRCRRCSLGVREVRATMSLLQGMPQVAPGSHFDEDLYARIRSGEGLRPSVRDVMREIFAPARLRPAFMAGAAVCAVWIAVTLSPFGKGSAPVRGTEPRTAVNPVPDTGPGVNEIQAPATAPEIPAGRVASRPPAASSVVASVPVRAAATRDSIVDLRIPEQGYKDEIINDQFYLERGLEGQDPAVVPVNTSSDDDVYIVF